MKLAAYCGLLFMLSLCIVRTQSKSKHYLVETEDSQDYMGPSPSYSLGAEGSDYDDFVPTEPGKV